MSVALSYTKEQRGPSLLLNFALNCFIDYNNGIKSKQFLIDNLGNVQFNFEYNKNDRKVTLSYVSIKHTSVNGSKVIINVTSETLKYSEEIVCPENKAETKWNCMGTLCHTNSCNNVLLFLLKVSVNVMKAEEPIMNVKLYRDTKLTDCHLNAEGGTVAMHKLFLASQSDVIMSLLLKEWNSKEIEMEGVTLQTLQDLKQYLYLGILPETGLFHLLLFARRYSFNNLKTDCVRKLIATVTSDSLYRYVEFACLNNIPELAFGMMHSTPIDTIHAGYQLQKNKQSF